MNTKFKKGMIPWNKGLQHSEKTIRKIILKRDNYTCQLCSKRGGILHVDHIQSWEEYIKLRFNLKNCRTLCRNCHYFITFHKPIPKNSKWGLNSIKEVD